MTSHELAHAMIATAEFLLAHDSFNTPSPSHSLYLGSFWDDKESLIAMVRAVGNVTKSYSQHDLEVRTKTPVEIWTRISRDKVCRKIQDAKYECEPLLTPDDEAALAKY